ncbi:MAG: hypothetical protein SFY32_06850 [Bacteroidota bacterium]|nr:hypothetical protein [Bacteroidota bacterium]
MNFHYLTISIFLFSAICLAQKEDSDKISKLEARLSALESKKNSEFKQITFENDKIINKYIPFGEYFIINGTIDKDVKNIKVLIKQTDFAQTPIFSKQTDVVDGKFSILVDRLLNYSNEYKFEFIPITNQPLEFSNDISDEYYSPEIYYENIKHFKTKKSFNRISKEYYEVKTRNLFDDLISERKFEVNDLTSTLTSISDFDIDCQNCNTDFELLIETLTDKINQASINLKNLSIKNKSNRKRRSDYGGRRGGCTRLGILYPPKYFSYLTQYKKYHRDLFLLLLEVYKYRSWKEQNSKELIYKTTQISFRATKEIHLKNISTELKCTGSNCDSLIKDINHTIFCQDLVYDNNLAIPPSFIKINSCCNIGVVKSKNDSAKLNKDETITFSSKDFINVSFKNVNQNISTNNSKPKIIHQYFWTKADSNTYRFSKINLTQGIGACVLGDNIDNTIWFSYTGIKYNFSPVFRHLDNPYYLQNRWWKFWKRSSLIIGAVTLSDQNFKYKGVLLESTELNVKPIIALGYDFNRFFSLTAGVVFYKQLSIYPTQDLSQHKSSFFVTANLNSSLITMIVSKFTK